tara:strand:- start:104 stop:481 length:378 start_codon:yes stop_codon:yes gene_type:complete
MKDDKDNKWVSHRSKLWDKYEKEKGANFSDKFRFSIDLSKSKYKLKKPVELKTLKEEEFLARQKDIPQYNKSGVSKDDKEGRESEPLREMNFFHWVLVILFWGLFFWLLGENGCPDIDRSYPIRR